MNLDLVGKVVLITGAARGIGAASARAFSAEGARVMVMDRDRELAEKLSAEIGGRALAADLTDDGACERIVHETIAAEGHLCPGE